ncbi:hypothetical protein [Legionella feeleii]|uniref:Uncharacterized protein n=1 Tax=Legionella feeleii TaxID=453 RepID=A0A378IQH5_9GAMM|nr:hypothetical protein [Legionella feeleii]STX37486.1 Uncharacterised protein [Legionella feeleii]
MKTAFIETSAINWLSDHAINAHTCNQIFATYKLTPVIGMDTIYELGRCFTTIPKRGSELFSWLNQLKPIYSCQRAILYSQELDNLLRGSSINALLGYYSEEILAKRIKDFSSGIFENIHEEFIAGRQFFWDDCREKLWNPNKVKQNLGLTFKNYLHHCLKQIETNISILQKWVKELTGKRLSKENTILLLKKLNAYPALRTALYSQFYLNFLIIRNRSIPSEDKFTDSLQVIGASYFSSIVSNDKYLIDTLANTVNPDIQVIKVQAINSPAHSI